MQHPVDITFFSNSSDAEELEESICADVDQILPISIISKAAVDLLRVPYKLWEHPPVKDSESTVYFPIGQVELRWHKKDEAKSFDELLFVVDDSVPLIRLGATAFPEATNPAAPGVPRILLE